MNNYWKNKKILITGGGGFIGSNAIDFFLKKGAIISATVSPHIADSDIKRKFGDNITKINIIKIDLIDKRNVIKIAEGMEIIMNFAAVDGGMKFKIEHSLEIYKKNISITKNLLSAGVRVKAKAFLLLSSAEIYPVTDAHPITEDQAINLAWRPEKEGYKLSKWKSEQDAIKTAKKSGLNIVIVRPANIYGPKDNFEDESKIRFIPALIKKVYLDKKPVVIWGDGSQVRSFLYIEDFIKTCASLIENGVFNIPINVASKNHITLKSLAQKILALSNTNNLMTDSQKNGGAQNMTLDISLLENKIGLFKETSLRIGLKKTIQYFQNSLAEDTK